jgi:hypothetical protein
MDASKAERLAAIRAANAARAAAEAPVEPLEADAPAATESVASVAAAAPAAAAPAVRPAVAARPANRLEVSDMAANPPAMSPQTLLGILAASIGGAVAAVYVLPSWVPGLATSMTGEAPKAFWYLSRSSGVVAYALLWLSMIFGLLITTRTARLWPGGPAAFDLHQHTSLLGTALAVFHALILLGDRWIQATITQVLMPFSYTGHEPTWVGLGQLALYGMALVSFSFYVKDAIGRTGWRLLHFVSFVIWAATLLHSIYAGSDTELSAMQVWYWLSGGSVLFLTVLRVLAAMTTPKRSAAGTV